MIAIFLWKEGAKEESMSKRSVATSWTAKRKLQVAAAHMRQLIKAKLSLPTSEHGSKPTPSSNTIESSGFSATPSLSDPTSATVDRDNESSVHSESKNERDGLENSSDKVMSVFDSENAQGVFDDWVISLPLLNRKILAVMLMETLQKGTAVSQQLLGWKLPG